MVGHKLTLVVRAAAAAKQKKHQKQHEQRKPSRDTPLEVPKVGT